MQASPTKLPDDTWGVRIYDPSGDAGAWSGQPVTVTSTGGKSWQSVLGEMVENNPAKHFAKYRKAAKDQAVQPTLVQVAQALPAPVEDPDMPAGPTIFPGHVTMAQPVPTEDIVITKVVTPFAATRQMADLLKAARIADPTVSIAEMAHAAAALAMDEMAKGV